MKSSSSHDSLFLPLPKKPSKDSFAHQADDIINSSNDTFEGLTAISQDTDSTPSKLVTIQAKQRKRSSVQLLVSPTTKNTDIRMFYDRPLSLSMVPIEKQQKQQHQQHQHALPSPPPSATLSETTSSFNHCQLDKAEETATATEQQSDLGTSRGRTFSFSHGSHANNDNSSLYISTQSQRRHHRLAHQRSVSPTVVSIHTEHAEPTFIRATTPSAISQPIPLTTSSSTTICLGGDMTPVQTSSPSSTSPKATKPPTTTGVTREHLLKVKNRQGLKSYRSDSDLGRLKSIFMPSASISTNSNNSAKYQRKEVPTKPPTTYSSSTIKPPLLSPPPLSHSSSLQSLSSMLRPLAPQRTPSTRVIHKSSCSNLKEIHDPQLPTITTTSSTKLDSR